MSNLTNPLTNDEIYNLQKRIELEGTLCLAPKEREYLFGRVFNEDQRLLFASMDVKTMKEAYEEYQRLLDENGMLLQAIANHEILHHEGKEELRIAQNMIAALTPDFSLLRTTATGATLQEQDEQQMKKNQEASQLLELLQSTNFPDAIEYYKERVVEAAKVLNERDVFQKERDIARKDAENFYHRWAEVQVNNTVAQNGTEIAKMLMAATERAVLAESQYGLAHKALYRLRYEHNNYIATEALENIKTITMENFAC